MVYCVITPRLSPLADGLGDFCRRLWDNWPDKDQKWQFLVLEGAAGSKEIWTEVEIDNFNADTIETQLASLAPDLVILHYVGYAYSPDGCPTWLNTALSTYKASGGRLAVMFHETWSSGLPWQSAFWHQKKQKQCIGNLLDLADLVVTTTRANLYSLLDIRPKATIKIIHLGNSFGELPTLAKKWQQLLIFGKEPSRQRAIHRHEQLLHSLCSKGLIKRIVLAGSKNDIDSNREKKMLEHICKNADHDVEIITCYNFDEQHIPTSILQSGLSLMHTQSTHLLKSTSFQLAANLGQVAICIRELPADLPFEPLVHYIDYTPKRMDFVHSAVSHPAALQVISENLYDAGKEQLSWSRIARDWHNSINTILGN